MPLRYVVRPQNIRKTPRRLAEALGVQTRRPSAGPFSYNECFFFYYPQEITDAPGSIHYVREFFRSNKLQQREYLSGHRTFNYRASVGQTDTGDREYYGGALLSLRRLPIPETRGIHQRRVGGAGFESNYISTRDINISSPLTINTERSDLWIVRPLVHSGGRHYRITESEDDFIEGQEYISRLFEKDREYRIIYVFGEPLVTLRKTVPPSLTNDQPWNHANGSRFITLHQPSRLHRTTVFEDLSRNEIIKYADIVGVDVMYKNTGEYVICEFNACPSLLIDDNLERIARHVQAHSRYR